MTQKFDDVYIEAISACVPKNRVVNDAFSHLLEPKDIRKFERTTGIKERRYANETTTASDLGYIAAKKILDEKKCQTEIEILIFLSQTPDYKIPFTSNILQDRLGLSQETLCLDINAGCAGFIQGLSTAFSLANTIKGKVLLIVSETLSKILSKEDKSTSMLFGDGASAILINKDINVKSTSYFNFFSDGSNADAIIVPDGGCKNPFNQDSLSWSEDEKGNKNKGIHLKMDGPRVFDFTLREIPKSIDGLINKFSLRKEEIDLFLFHQSNKFIINQIASRLKVDKTKVPLNISDFGNTSNVTIPLLMVTNFRDSSLPKKILCSGYGAGLNWGNCILDVFKDMVLFDLIEV